MQPAAENRTEMEDKFRQERRLPSRQVLTSKLTVLHYGPVPRFDEKTWDFRVWEEAGYHKEGTVWKEERLIR